MATLFDKCLEVFPQGMTKSARNFIKFPREKPSHVEVFPCPKKLSMGDSYYISPELRIFMERRPYVTDLNVAVPLTFSGK